MKENRYSVGQVIKSVSCGDMKILAFVGNFKATVQFEDGFTKTVYKCDLNEGRVLNPMKPTINGVGYKGVGEFKYQGKEYSTWRGILSRCYPTKELKKNTRYKGCIMCEEWHNFQNFAKWYSSQPNAYKKGYQVDKDFRVLGNKIYSPETCCLVPERINVLLSSPPPNYSGYIGVDYNKVENAFKVSCTNVFGKRVYFGRYKTPSEAEKVYIENKRRCCFEILKILHEDIPKEILGNLHVIIDKYYPDKYNL